MTRIFLIAFYNGRDIHLSQHFGDLDNDLSQEYYNRERDKILEFYKISKLSVSYVRDMHPDYYTSHYLSENPNLLRCPPVQHHKAHLAAALAEFDLQEDYLGVVWDGTGYGENHSIWGGEFFYGTSKNNFRRIGNLRPFRLAGGESAIRYPWKNLFGICHELADLNLLTQMRHKVNAWTEKEQTLLWSLVNQGQNSPLT